MQTGATDFLKSADKEIFQGFLAGLEDIILAAVSLIPAIVEGALFVAEALYSTFHDLFSVPEKVVRRVPLRVRNGLSDFDALVGRLISEARARRGARLPKAAWVEIARAVDARKFKPVRHLEESFRSTLAQRNRNSSKAIHTFEDCLRTKGIMRRGALKRFYRASDNWELAALDLSA